MKGKIDKLQARIAELETQLRRQRKAIDDRSREIAALTEKLSAAQRGAKETAMLVDGIMTALAVRYGVKVFDEGDGEKHQLAHRPLIGYRLMVPQFSIADQRSKYELQATRDPNGSTDYVYCVALKVTD